MLRCGLSRPCRGSRRSDRAQVRGCRAPDQAPRRSCRGSPTPPPRRRCGSPAREAADTPPCSKATWQAEEVGGAVVAADLPAPPARRPQKVRHSTEQCSCDHDALNLVRALIDLRNLGVAHHSLDRVVADVPVSPKQLHAIRGHPHGHIRGEQLCHGRDLRQVGRLGVHFRSRAIDEMTRGLDLRRDVGQPRMPSLCSSFATVHGLASRSRTNAEMPRWSLPGWVSAKTTSVPATLPCVMNCLVPLSTYSWPYFFARVFIAAASEPLPGSESAYAAIFSPDASGGHSLFFCSSDPATRIG